jgi:hypothetical protein
VKGENLNEEDDDEEKRKICEEEKRKSFIQKQQLYHLARTLTFSRSYCCC